MRVIRAYHPLAGQVVKVLRQTREPGREEPRWVVQPPGRPPVSLPLSWAVLLDDTTDPVPCPIEPLKVGPCLPRDVPPEQLRRLLAEIETVATADHARKRRMGLLVRAWFLLMLHSGLRVGEVRRLRQGELDLEAWRLRIEQSKGLKDRLVYLSPATVKALHAYAEVRGPAGSDHVFLYRHLPLCKDLVRGRIKASGERAGVKVYPHRLRHTCATQLLNAGCRVTSIQKFLGHKRLNSTMIYARVHDQTVADDYYSAMERVEQRLDIAPSPTITDEGNGSKPLSDEEREQVLDLAEQLAEPELSVEVQLSLIECLRRVLDRRLPAEGENAPTPNENGRRPRAPPPPSPVPSWAKLA